MDPKLMEDLSRLMDGDTTSESREALVEYLVLYPELRTLWQRYHIIRAGLKNELKTGDNMVAKVRAAIEAEPAPWEMTEKSTKE